MKYSVFAQNMGEAQIFHHQHYVNKIIKQSGIFCW